MRHGSLKYQTLWFSMLDQSRFSTGPPATPHHTQTMARALPGKAKAVWAAKSRCLWRQSPTMFGHHLRLLCTVCWVVDANHSQRPWAFPQWRRGMPFTSNGAGPSHHGQWWMHKALTVKGGLRRRGTIPPTPLVGLACPWTTRDGLHIQRVVTSRRCLVERSLGPQC